MRPLLLSVGILICTGPGILQAQLPTPSTFEPAPPPDPDPRNSGQLPPPPGLGELPPPAVAPPMPAGVPATALPRERAWLDLAKPREPAAGADELQRLLVERYNTAAAALWTKGEAYRAGTVPFAELPAACERLLQAELELSAKPADQIAALERHLEVSKQLEQSVKTLYDKGSKGGEKDKYEQAKYLRIDAEIRLIRAKRQAGLAAPGDDELQRLLQARYDAVVAESKSKGHAYSAGVVTYTSLFECSERLLQAELELSEKPADQLAAYQQYLEGTKHHELGVKAQYDAQSVGGEPGEVLSSHVQENRCGNSLAPRQAKRRHGQVTPRGQP